MAPVRVALGLALKVTVLAVASIAAKDAVTPLGRPVAEKVTALLNPLITVALIVDDVVPPCLTESPEEGEALNPTKAGNSTVT